MYWKSREKIESFLVFIFKFTLQRKKVTAQLIALGSAFLSCGLKDTIKKNVCRFSLWQFPLPVTRSHWTWDGRVSPWHFFSFVAEVTGPLLFVCHVHYSGINSSTGILPLETNHNSQKTKTTQTDFWIF